MTISVKFRHFARGRGGVAATEFALVLPVLLLSWLGMSQALQMSMASAKTGMAAQSVADLVTRYANGGYTGTSFSGIEAAAQTIIAPLATGANNPSIAIVAARLNSSGIPTQTWACTNGTNAPTASQIGTALGAAPGLTTQNSNLTSIVMVMVTYSYTPTITGGPLGATNTYTATAFSTPRTVSTVPDPC
jgi:Flp pilus assembly protein TadG